MLVLFGCLNPFPLTLFLLVFSGVFVFENEHLLRLYLSFAFVLKTSVCRFQLFPFFGRKMVFQWKIHPPTKWDRVSLYITIYIHIVSIYFVNASHVPLSNLEWFVCLSHFDVIYLYGDTCEFDSRISRLQHLFCFFFPFYCAKYYFARYEKCFISTPVLFLLFLDFSCVVVIALVGFHFSFSTNFHFEVARQAKW